MGQTKAKLQAGSAAFGGWVMIGHPTVAELLAGEAFDWIAVDMEHTATDLSAFENICRAVEGSGKDVLVRLHSCDEVLAKRVLDIGADGIIVPNVCTREEAEQAVRIAKYPPEGIRGASLARCTDHGRNFSEYFAAHNESVLVVVMLEHVKAVENVDEILAVPGIDATFIGPYDLSASMNLAGQLDHPDVLGAQQRIVDACAQAGVPSGIHVVPMDRAEVERRVEQGFRFIALGLDTEFIIQGARAMLG
jgi:2-dehydro-3-deoxyglucarate aldolase